MSLPLSVQDAQLAANDRVTVSKLLKLGLAQADLPYTMTSAALGSSGLSTNGLVALVRAKLPRKLDAEGTELRAATMVAKEVTVYQDGSALLTLAVDLAD